MSYRAAAPDHARPGRLRSQRHAPDCALPSALCRSLHRRPSPARSGCAAACGHRQLDGRLSVHAPARRSTIPGADRTLSVIHSPGVPIARMGRSPARSRARWLRARSSRCLPALPERWVHPERALLGRVAQIARGDPGVRRAARERSPRPASVRTLPGSDPLNPRAMGSSSKLCAAATFPVPLSLVYAPHRRDGAAVDRPPRLFKLVPSAPLHLAR